MAKNERLATGMKAASLLAIFGGGLAVATKSANMSVSLLLTRLALGLQPKPLDDAAKVRQQLSGRSYPEEAPLPNALRRKCGVEEWECDGQKVVTLPPHVDRTDTHILYLHGGAYINPMIRAHWAIINALIDATGASVTVPFYALAPENDYRPGTALVDAVYDHLAMTRPNERIVVAGDSAGGNFALTLALRRRDADLPLPDRLILFSPWLDLTLRDPDMKSMERNDVMLGVDGLRLCGRWWAGETDPASPPMSPLYADLSGLPPMMLFQGDRDIFVVDSRTFAAKAGSLCQYREYPGGFHVFMGATFTPEAKDVFRHVKNAILG